MQPDTKRDLSEPLPALLTAPCLGAFIPFAERARLRLPLFASRVAAGFPSPADDYVEEQLDLNDLIRHPAATFFVRAIGDSMTGVGIRDGDLLIVDRAEEPADRRIVVAVIGNELTVKRMRRRGRRIYLLPENEAYPPIEITGEEHFEVWGVVTHVLRTFV